MRCSSPFGPKTLKQIKTNSHKPFESISWMSSYMFWKNPLFQPLTKRSEEAYNQTPFSILFSQSPAETFGSATTPSPVKHHLQRVRLWPGHPFPQVELAPTLPTFGNVVQKPDSWIWLPSNIVTQHGSHPVNIALHVREVFLNLIRNALKFLLPFWWKPWGNAPNTVDSSQEFLRLMLQSLRKHQQRILRQKLVRHVLADTTEHIQKFFTTLKSSRDAFLCFQLFTRRKSCRPIPEMRFLSKLKSYKTNKRKTQLQDFFWQFLFELSPTFSRNKGERLWNLLFLKPCFGLSISVGIFQCHWWREDRNPITYLIDFCWNIEKVWNQVGRLKATN